MIEATCSACGTLNRIAEADVPGGAKFVNCSSCKSRVALPNRTAGAIPAIPKPPMPKMPPPTPKPGVALGPITGPKQPAEGIGLSDLPAPKQRQSALGNEPSKPAPRSALSSAMEDLPAPRPPGGGAPPSLDLDDLLAQADLVAPVAPKGVSDLPAPRGRAATPPQPMQPAGVSDLPAPKLRPSAGRPPPSASSSPIDLPAPRGPGITDLPAPRHGISDLPAPKPGGGSNLPTPKHGGGSNLPTPKGNQQTAAARNAELDLPTPKGGVDLPAPKGFFDDLPQPAHGGGRNLPQPARGSERPEVPAPKGFFDDLPQPSRNKPTNDIAPKGFFDDLPGRAPATSQGDHPEVPAPKGFFDDLPQPARSKHDSHEIGLGAMPLDLGDGGPIELAEQPSSAGGSFDELDLSKPSVGEHAVTPQGPIDEDNKAVIRFGGKKAEAKGPGTEKAPLPNLGRPPADAPLELEEPKAVGGQILQPKRVRERVVDDAVGQAKRAQRSKVILITVLGLAAVGGGGFYLYQRHVASQARADEIDSQINLARKSLLAEDANHWQRAQTAAAKVVELDDSNAEALGIGAEAAFAGAFADGKNMVARFGQGRKLINDALSNGVTGPALDRASALSTLTTAPDKAIPKLQGLMAKAPKDGLLVLYLGWAQSSAGDQPAAMKSFDQAMKLTPSLKVLALDGRARAKLAQADVEGARSDFSEILAIPGQKDNIAAQVGIASTLPQSQAQQQEADLLAILERKDIKTGDPRAVVSAYVIAANAALNSRRVDVARERFRKALLIDPKSVAVMTGLAETELGDRKIEAANDWITKALTQSKDDVRAQLVAADIEIKLGKLDTAAERLQRLGTKKPPLSTLEQVKLQSIMGRMFEAQNKDEAAVEAYAAAAKLAGDFDLSPTMSAVTKLNDMARKAAEARNPAKEAEYKARADQLLSVLDDKAQTDPQLAMMLGVAYLLSNNPEKAEGYLRRVVEARPNDADALYQYGKALGLLTKFTEAVEQLKKARELAPGRSEIGLELAITYERTKNDAEAGKLYDALVERDDATIETRAHAGKYYVRTNQIPKAGEQGNKIVAADPEHAAGHYLKGEGLMAQGRADDARKEFFDAVRIERDPLYLDGQGRALEAVALERKDTALEEQALNAYKAAAELDPLMFDPQLGAARVYVHRREHGKALQYLIAADGIKANNAEVAYLYGISYAALGGQKKKLAVDWLERAIKLKPNADAAYQLGEMYSDSEIDRGGPAQSAYAVAVRLWKKQEKDTGETVATLTDALYKLGDMAKKNHDDSAAKAAWEQWVVRPGLRAGPRLNEVRYLLQTELKSAPPPPIEK